MNFSKNKTAATIATILILTIVLPMVALPLANAHTPPWEISTFAYINAAPSPVGVGQQVSILIWCDKPRTNAALSNDYRMHNYQLVITDSAGNEVLNQFWQSITDPTSSQFYAWVPDAAGTYNLTFNFQGFAANDFGHDPSETNDTYLPDSASTTVVVQQEQIPSPITSYPLPTEYWTRPIYGENTDWWSISSNWLGEGSPTITAWPAIFGYGNLAGIDRDPGNGVGPLTSHIMWTKPLQEGGVVGDNNFPIAGNTWFEGSAYNQRFGNPIIVAGLLIYNPPISFYSAASLGGSGVGPTTCVDLRTGELKWSTTDIPPPSFAIIYDVEDPQQHGVHPAMLVQASGFGTTTWNIWDAWTGTKLVTVTGIPSGVSSLGPQGEYLIYTIANAGTNSNPDYRLRLWNSSLLWTGTGWANPTSTTLVPVWDTTTTTTTTNVTTTTYVNGSIVTTQTPTTTTTTAVDGSISSGTHTRYSWDVPISWRNGMSPAPSFIFGSVEYNDVLVLRQGTQPGLTLGGFGTNSQAPYTYIGVNLNTTSHSYALGAEMWTNTLSPPPRNITVCGGIIDPVSRVFTETYKETMQHVGFDLDTGQKLWTTASQVDLDYYGNPSIPWLASAAYEGKLYSCAYGGILYAYDLRTGDLLWTYGNGGPGNSTNSEFYLAYGHYPIQMGAFASGLVYVFTTEHTVNTPIYKGAEWRAVNATTGAEVWTLSGYTGTFFVFSNAVADGFLTFFNGYDNQIYSVGRGPSTMTVSAPNLAAASGQPVVISGSVLDISAGSKQNEQAARFPNGIPLAADSVMGDWMGYVYQQRPLPSDFVGVNVDISVVDSNGNYRSIGTATTDSKGNYNLVWTPDIPGTYQVYASFAGTKAYWPSSSTAAFNVMEAHPTVAPTTAPVASNTDTYVLVSAIAIIIVVLIIGALLLRKRP
jgi:hypothetical protein